ncbi:hypothetical protein HK099_002055 [Clydaea vesicula]|uniref:Uncharacterized protein n=1 Tax=Clydaea vesicula TaxID=447962 RepID=A0AAD5U605_9FUNG|nr:hypothetical protein HK099_002055 [Clydaea vesicula]
MSTFNICTTLPQTTIDDLRNNGAEVRDACEIIVFNVLDPQPIEIFDKFLQADKEVDPLLTPHFGNPAAPYVAYNIQLEIYQLLHAYQQIPAANLVPVPQLTPIANLVIPPGGGYQYHYAQIAINYVMKQIENPDVGFGLVGLPHVPSGTYVDYADFKKKIAKEVINNSLSQEQYLLSNKKHHSEEFKLAALYAIV